MIKKNIDYRLVNISLLALIIFLIIKTLYFWNGVAVLLVKLCSPFFIAFILSYAVYPLFCFLNKRLPKILSCLIIVLSLIISLVIFIFSLLPILVMQIIPAIENVIFFLKELSFKYQINLEILFYYIDNIYKFLLEKTSNYLFKGLVEMIELSIKLFTNILIVLVSFIYFLIDMDSIRNFIKENIKGNLYNYLSGLDKEVNNYFRAFSQVIVITFFEYLIVYLIVGHPNYLLLALLASLANLIPFFGSIISNLFAFITAFSIGPVLLLKICFVWIICMILDSYVINPLVYSKKNNIHPLVVIISVFVFGLLFGPFGIVFSLPLAIIILHTIKFILKDKTNMI